jgi:diacylglycerol kinase family enzyme
MPFVFVGNNKYELKLPNLGRRAALDDGELCLFVANHQTPWGLVRLALRAARGRLDEARDLEVHRGLQALEIRSRASRLRVALDGEIAFVETPLRYRIRPRSLRVFTPALAAE